MPEEPNRTGYEQLRLENQLCFPLYACGRRIVSKYTPWFHDLGLTYTQYIVFMVLWEEDGCTVGDLCRRLYLDSGTLTPLLKKMEDAGRIERRRCDADERVVRVFLTDEGRALREKVKDIPFEVGRCMRLTPEEAGTLYRLLYRVLDELEDDRT